MTKRDLIEIINDWIGTLRYHRNWKKLQNYVYEIDDEDIEALADTLEEK